MYRSSWNLLQKRYHDGVRVPNQLKVVFEGVCFVDRGLDFDHRFASTMNLEVACVDLTHHSFWPRLVSPCNSEDENKEETERATIAW
jgi:hypothetical protein